MRECERQQRPRPPEIKILQRFLACCTRSRPVAPRRCASCRSMPRMMTICMARQYRQRKLTAETRAKLSAQRNRRRPSSRWSRKAGRIAQETRWLSSMLSALLLGGTAITLPRVVLTCIAALLPGNDDELRVFLCHASISPPCCDDGQCLSLIEPTIGRSMRSLANPPPPCMSPSVHPAPAAQVVRPLEALHRLRVGTARRQEAHQAAATQPQLLRRRCGSAFCPHAAHADRSCIISPPRIPPSTCRCSAVLRAGPAARCW